MACHLHIRAAIKKIPQESGARVIYPAGECGGCRSLLPAGQALHHTKAGAAGTRVALSLGLFGFQSALSDGSQPWNAPTTANRQIGRTDTALYLLLHKLLHDAVFQRVE